MPGEETNQVDRYRVAFIEDYCRVVAEVPYGLYPGVVLDRATLREAEEISRFLDGELGGRSVSPTLPQEMTRVESRGGGVALSPRPVGERHYIVLRSDTASESFDLAECALALSRSEFRIAFAFTLGPGGIAGRSVLQVGAKERLEALPNSVQGPRTIGRGELRDVRAMSVAIAEDGVAEFVRAAVYVFLEARKVAVLSPLSFIGYAAVLEILLTHQGSSISEQLRAYLVYLVLDALPAIPHQMGDRVLRRKFWTDVYDLRSKVAHAGMLRPKSGSSIKSTDCPKLPDFLDALAREILRLALEKPSVVHDLRRGYCSLSPAPAPGSP